MPNNTQPAAIAARVILAHPIVSTLTTNGGIGIGRLVGGAVFVRANNRFYFPGRDVVDYVEDNGDCYMKTAHKMFTPVN